MRDPGVGARKFVHALRVKAIWILMILTETLIWILIILAGTSMAGCNVGPNYQQPKVQPAAFRAPGESEQPQAQALSYADLPWWQVFQDPQL
jgi:hypothetical protein